MVTPSNVPESILTLSNSFLWVVYLLWPGLLLSNQGCISASLSPTPGGHPSTVAPIALPWLSPHVVTLNKWPNELIDISNNLSI